MKRSLALSLGLLTVATLAGCLGGDEPGGAADTPVATEDPLHHRVVVAVIDSAINPYHEHFQRNTSVPDEVLATLVDPTTGLAPERVQLSTEGGWDQRRGADSKFWDSVESGRLYYFEGTNVLAVSFGGNVIDGGSHGTGTSASVFDANPDALVILVQGMGGSEGEQWAATMPFVDILSESYGLYCGQPVMELLPGDSTAKNNKLAWDNHKLVVGAADNTPCPAFNDGTSGPPWVVGVAGDHPATEGSCREHVSGNFPDFTADFTQELPRDKSLDEYGSSSGTSFSTPTTAGSMSRALLQVREAWGHEGGITDDGALAVGPGGERLDKIGLREAFNRTAYYFDVSATCGEPGSVPVNPAAPWLQMGWGHVDALVGDHAARVILGEEPAPERPQEAVTYQEGLYDYRWLAWSTVI